jgi:hypothetical protein
VRMTSNCMRGEWIRRELVKKHEGKHDERGSRILKRSEVVVWGGEAGVYEPLGMPKVLEGWSSRMTSEISMIPRRSAFFEGVKSGENKNHV